tara:strand:+ start:210 stop:668 length:459 start_codon:yes stop_codon:yes gene_type:complete
MTEKWVPEIVYEDGEGGMSSHIPMIVVPIEEEMPKMLFVFESRESGEFEPGPDGEDLPVTELDLHQYADMAVLKKNLTWVEYDNVRCVLGLEPLEAAAMKGSKITSNIRVALSKDGTGDALDNQDGSNKLRPMTFTPDGFRVASDDTSESNK